MTRYPAEYIQIERIHDGGGCYHLGYKPAVAPFFRYPTHDDTCEKRVVTLPSYEVPDWDKQVVGVTVREPDTLPWHNARDIPTFIVASTPRSIGTRTPPRVSDVVFRCDKPDCMFWSFNQSKATRHMDRKGDEHTITTNDTLQEA